MPPTVPKKQFKIEPFKHPIKRDPQWADDTWKMLERAIHEINNHNESQLSFEELYRNGYNMVINKFGDRLYTGLEDTQREHLRKIAAIISDAQGGEGLLREMKLRWDNHNKSMQMIRDVLMYMDRIYVPQWSKAPVHQLGLDLWRDVVVRHDAVVQHTIPERLQLTMLGMVAAERNGDKIDRTLMKAMTTMLVDLGVTVYEEDFEQPFLFATTEFYQAEAQANIASCDCPEYLRRAERRLQQELERVGHYLDPRSEHKLTKAVETELLQKQMQVLVEMDNSGLVPLLEADRYEDLGRMYLLLKRVTGGLQLVQLGMHNHVKGIGMTLVRDPEATKEPIGFVQRLLDEKTKYDAIIANAFGNDRMFQNSLNQAFDHFVNEFSRSPEYISLFMDDLLRKSIKSMKEEEVDGLLDKVMMLFRYLKDKDVFEKYYKQHLAKRLLSGRTVGEDAERTMLVKLKTECGYQFTSKLESMFNDIKISRESMGDFKHALAARGIELDAEITVQVLTTGSWPTPVVPKCSLPRELEQACDAFQHHYLEAHSNRKLAWQTNMGNADLKMVFADGRKHELNVSTYQMAILMLFNEADRLSYVDIAEATQIPPADLKRSLQSLACVKGKNVLRKEPMSKEIDERDVFTFNESFTSKLYKVKIGTVAAQKESEPEKQETRARVEEDRKPEVEAAIVRIMKARRILDHNLIVAEVTKQLSSRFVPTPALIKKRIESLIEREFLERDAGDRKVYKYLA